MKNEQTQVEGKDFFLLLFVLVAGWMLLFQSGLIR